MCKLDVNQKRNLRSVMGIKWQDRVRNVAILDVPKYGATSGKQMPPVVRPCSQNGR